MLLITFKKMAVSITTTFLLLYSTHQIQAKQQPEPLEKKFDFDEVVYNWTRTYAEVLGLAKDKHYKVSDLQNCMIKSIDAFLNCLDPHSSLLDPKTYKAILDSTSGEFFGIGIVLDNTRQPKDKFLIVVDTIPDGPADKAGIIAYDKIIEIDGQVLDGMTTEEITSKLKGERNTNVIVKVLREGKQDPLSFTITRDVIKEQSSVSFFINEHNIYYVSLSTFSDNAVRQIKELVQKSNKNNYKGLILDLRNNSGGLLTAAIDIAGLFLDKGSLIVTTKDKSGNIIDNYLTTQNPVVNSSLPIFILINNFTASAAEILAGALKIHSQELSNKTSAKHQKKLMVFVVGTNSFGKGSVQEVVPVGNDCAVKITTSLYFMPNGSSVQGIGIEPDFIIDRQFPAPEQVVWFTKNYGQERTLSNYIKVPENEQTLDGSKKPTTQDNPQLQNWSERMQKQLNSDNQFRSCITLINIFDTGKRCLPAQINTRDNAIKFMKSNFVTDEILAMQEVSS